MRDKHPAPLRVYGRMVPHTRDFDSPPAPASASPSIGHGPRCDCVFLCAATRGGADAVTFSYCRHILQKRYAMTCMHGELRHRPQAMVRETWHDLGEIDAVKAILLTNN